MGGALVACATPPTPTAVPDASPPSASGFEPSGFEGDVKKLSDAGWFRLVPRNPDQDSLSGFDLEVGTLDGRLARTISKRYGPLRPSAAYRGALPIAAGPFGDTVLYAFWDGLKSELHTVSVTTGADTILASRDDIIHAVTMDPISGDIYFITLDAGARQEVGIFRLPAGGGPAAAFIRPAKEDVGQQSDQIWQRLLVTPNGSMLVQIDCPAACAVSVASSRDGTPIGQFPMVDAQDVVGVTDDALVAVFGCEAPCPATTYELRTGAARSTGAFCEVGVLTEVAGKPWLVSDWPIEGKCFTAEYRVGRSDVATGDAVNIQTWPARDRTLVASNSLQGAAPPEGWFVLGPTGGLVGFGQQQELTPWLVRAKDALVVPLPSLGPARPPI